MTPTLVAAPSTLTPAVSVNVVHWISLLGTLHFDLALAHGVLCRHLIADDIVHHIRILELDEAETFLLALLLVVRMTEVGNLPVLTEVAADDFLRCVGIETSNKNLQ